MRRASLIFSVVLIVAIAVGYWARTSELHRARDLRLETSAQVGAAQLASLVDGVVVAAGVGADPATVASALVTAEPQLRVCVVGAAVVCEGRGPEPDPALVERHHERRAGGVVAAAPPGVTSYEGQVTIDAIGPEVTVVVAVPVAAGAAVFPTTYVPAEAVAGSAFGPDDARQAAAEVVVPGVSGVYVVAREPVPAALPPSELRFYVVVFTLAVILFLLAGITLVLEHRSLVERASFDALTRLPNRTEFERRADDLLESQDGSTCCLLVFDLDGFKAVNDTYGHQTGDQMLRIVGERLRRAVRPDDLVGRWGGDEFVVLLRDVDTPEMGSRRARALADQIGGRTRLDGIDDPLRVRASVGIALLGVHGNDLGSLVEAADRAMYEAKRNHLVSCVAAPRDEPTMTMA